jgi:signal transduction histidine kinase/coenzyme F420-reducing hydrogenase delta subunit
MKSPKEQSLAAKNAELEKQLAAKNRDLEIEAALERVRTVAMGMRAADDLLNICKILFEELTSLGFTELRNAMINIVNDEKGSFLNYDFNGSDASVTPFQYNSHPVIDRQIEITRSASDAFIEHILIGDYLEEFKAFRVQNGEAPDLKLENISALYYYFYSIGIGSLGISTFSSLTEEKLKVLRRFRNVFDLAYRRYADIQLAAALAREAQIELALERVRARTMAMQHSDELAETAYILFQQFKELGKDPIQITIGIINEEKGIIEFNITNFEEVGSKVDNAYTVSIEATALMREIYAAWKEQKKSTVIELTGSDLNEWINYRNTLRGVVDATDHSGERRSLCAGFFSSGLISFSSAETQSQESIGILERFAGVFQQTYTRFLDLQKAEGQARESQIQLALERVRARTMAMQESEELAEVIQVIFEQLHQLDFNIDTANFVLNYNETDDFNLWIAVSGQQYAAKIHIPYFDHPIFNRYIEAKKKGPGFSADTFTHEEKNDFFKHFFKYAPEVPDERKALVFDTPGFARSAAFMKNTVLSINNYTGVLYSDAENNTLSRFGQVFEQTYTRFTDLKRAEEQAKEAQIQLALERVRARTMSMQKSDELAETATVLFQQLLNLGISSERTFIAIPNDDTRKIELWGTEQGGNQMSTRFEYEADATYAFREIYKAWQEKRSELTVILKGKNLEEHVNYVRNVLHMPLLVELVQEQRILYNAFFSKGLLMIVTPDIQSKETLEILERFAGVFDGTYTRFLDLQKAEAQTREGHIQLGLERVRAAALAMHDSNDVGNATALVFSELYKLGITTIRCGVCILDGATQQMEVWSASSSQEGGVNRGAGKLDMTAHPLWIKLLNAWKQKKSSFTYELAGKELADYYKAITNAPDYHAPDSKTLKITPDNTGSAKQYCNCFLFNEGCVFAFTQAPFSPETSQVLEKFTAVFGLTYRRYLDLKKAEAQAREAQIEAALERVRSKTMAMHNSADVGETVGVMFHEFVKLGIEKMIRCGIGIMSHENRTMELWTAKWGENEKVNLLIGHLDMTIHKMLGSIYDAWKSKQSDFTYLLAGSDLVTYAKVINSYPDYPLKYDLNSLPPAQFFNDFFFNEGVVFAFTSNSLSDEIVTVLKRFAGVFGQTYRRYLDLQKAEAQAREAQIEAALERVRSKTMAMHNSTDVGETVTLMFNELVKLGVDKIARCGIAIPDNNGLIELWTAKLGRDEKEEIIIGHIDTVIHPMLDLLYDAWKSKQAHFEYILEGDDLTNYITALNNYRGYPIKYEIGAWGAKQYHNDFFFHEGMVFAFTFQPLSVEIAAIFKRFAGVFGQTYRRYLDLQKAEAAAREAQIEAALERVRSKAMAMRSSGDLNDTANTVFIELRKLGVDLVRCGLGLMEKETHISTIHAATNTAEGGSLEVLGNINMDIHPVLEGIYNQWRRDEDYFPVLEAESLRTYYEALHQSGISVPEWKSGEKQYGYFLQFAYGSLYAWSGKQESELTIKTLKRFTSVISLTYTRYIELQKAESNTKEAVKQASLDRVRAEIASMRKRSDLERITPLIWDELTILGIPFIRCGVFIMDEEQQLIHTFLSTPDGKAIGAFHVPFDTSGNFEKMVDSWRNNKPYIDHWKEEAFSQFADTLVKQGAISSKAQYMRTLPHEGVHLNFLPFLQGMLYVGNSSPLAEDNIDLIQAVADAFSTAYARYEDFNKLEAAKQQVDNTLSDLKATQTKLIQSEKMASLGELTAGIAHEIQNPLNFVNNFSEVNQEMIDELEEELKAGNIEEALAIAADIKDNEQKINHHGKRADGIVKGMLQHSRTGGGEKQPTNMNALADEFLRLSYHGLGAKDKSFNAELVTNFDPDLPKINVIGQDMGRVMLNLFNNAFYTVNQKMKTAAAGYKPEVSVSTSTENGQVIIKVKDNGTGMPEHIKDKIMQPFFTTKPTGEGTGLGLSLTYDMVVKGHGGTIQVNSKEGEGSEFIITLPIK